MNENNENHDLRFKIRFSYKYISACKLKKVVSDSLGLVNFAMG